MQLLSPFDFIWNDFQTFRKLTWLYVETLIITLYHQNDISVFKFWTIGGIFLHMFSDALLFDMMLNTAYEDGVENHQDLLERDMYLGK